MPRYKDRRLQRIDALGRFESKSHQEHCRNAISLIGRLQDEGARFWDRDSNLFKKWQDYGNDMCTFLDTLTQRRDSEKQGLETAMREFIALSEHSTMRMYQLTFEAVDDPKNDERVKDLINLFDWVYVSATYVIVSAWLDDKQEKNEVNICVNLLSGDVKEEWIRTEQSVLTKYRKNTKQL